jgi:hypothetical protein
MSNLTEDKNNSDLGNKKSKQPVKKLPEDLEKSLSKMYGSGDFSRGDMSATSIQRPHSPVAEFLDHLEFEPQEKSLLILGKQVDALSDLESSSSSQGLETLDKDCTLPVPQPDWQRSLFSANQNVELHTEGDNDLTQELHPSPSPGVPSISKFVVTVRHTVCIQF